MDSLQDREKKAIFFDIDGTIFDTQSRKVPDRTIAAIRRARENGHFCFINTGRTRVLVDPVITDWVEFDGLLMGCGTMITYGKEVLLHKTFSEELSRRILSGLERFRIDAILEGGDSLYFPEPDGFYYGTFRSYAEKYRDMCCPYLKSAIGAFDKFFAYTERPQDMEAFLGEFAGELEGVDREKGYYEILPHAYSKASAMDFITRKLHIAPENTVAIGDSNNDLAMLDWAGTAIAMRDSSGQVLEMADFVTGDVADEGIWMALDWIGVL